MVLSKTSQTKLKIINSVPIKPTKPDANTTSVFSQLYNDLIEATEYIKYNKSIKLYPHFNLRVTHITSMKQIPKPQLFNSNSFPKMVREHIDQNTLYDLSYTFSLLERNITVHFLVEDCKIEDNIKKYNEYVERIYTLFYVINKYCCQTCSKQIAVFIYFTSLKKELPKSNIEVLGQNHVNTAFTYSCIEKYNEIVIFRTEEWFKVLIHESFHHFGLDFSDTHIKNIDKKISALFGVETQVNIFEAYTEFWGRMLNVCFCSFYLCDSEKISSHQKQQKKYIYFCYLFMDMERKYSLFQMNKTLDFMGLKYEILYTNTTDFNLLRKTMYKEKSSILSYYIITAILMDNYTNFLTWCKKYNTFSLLQFNKTSITLENFYKFIAFYYKSKSFLLTVDIVEKFFNKYKHKLNKNTQFMLNTMTMTVCELE